MNDELSETKVTESAQRDVSLRSGSRANATHRLLFIDRLRGLAVVFMFLWHTTDGWLHPSVRPSIFWDLLQLAGGLAAPFFLTLAGVSFAFQLERNRDRAFNQGIRRGLMLIAFGYGLRLQMWAIDGKALFYTSTLPAVGLMLVALIVWILAVKRRSHSHMIFGAFLGAGLFRVGTELGDRTWPGVYHELLRVDVLGVIGLTLIAVAVCSKIVRRSHHWLIGSIIAALFTGILQTNISLPHNAFTGLFIGITQNGNNPLSLFPLFPWLSYGLFGLWLGHQWKRHHSQHAFFGWAALGCAMMLLGSEAIPWIYRVIVNYPFVQHLHRIAYRLGFVLLFGAMLVFAENAWRARANKPSMDQLRYSPYLDVLKIFGSTSLVMYWVHLEFAFGFSVNSIKGQLSWGAWLFYLAILIVGMYVVALLRLRLFDGVAKMIMQIPSAKLPPAKRFGDKINFLDRR